MIMIMMKMIVMRIMIIIMIMMNQVVGLAPVSGMCLPASSCTVNEGRHFESVYVMAHEIGHK